MIKVEDERWRRTVDDCDSFLLGWKWVIDVEYNNSPYVNATLRYTGTDRQEAIKDFRDNLADDIAEIDEDVRKLDNV